MNFEDFKNRTIIPEMPPQEAPVEEPTPAEHPNTPILENMMMNEDEKFGENNQLLEHILMKLDDNSDKSVEEFQLLKQDEMVSAIKELTDVVKENNKWEVNLILE